MNGSHTPHRISSGLFRRSMQGLVWTVLLFSFATHVSHAATPLELPSVETSLSQNKVQVVEPFEFNVVVITQKGSRVYFPNTENKLGDFEILDQSDFPDLPNDDGTTRTWTRRFQLETIRTGELSIPPLEIQVTDNGQTLTLRTEAARISVGSVLEDRADPANYRDIKPEMDVNVPEESNSSWVYWMGGGAIGLLGLIALVAMVLNREDTITPREFAIGELARLADSAAVNDGASESVLESVADIVREYLHLEFEISAPKLTTQELLNEFANQKTFVKTEIDSLTSLLSLSDQAKFAGIVVDSQQLRTTIDAAMRLVNTLADQAELTTDVKPTDAGIKVSPVNVTDMGESDSTHEKEA